LPDHATRLILAVIPMRILFFCEYLLPTRERMKGRKPCNRCVASKVVGMTMKLMARYSNKQMKEKCYATWLEQVTKPMWSPLLPLRVRTLYYIWKIESRQHSVKQNQHIFWIYGLERVISWTVIQPKRSFLPLEGKQ